MSNQNLCPLCEQGQLHEKIEQIEVEYHDQHALLDSYYAVCDSCGAELATTEQAKRNKRAMIAFKKRVDGLLSGVQLRALREQWGITQAQATQIFGGGPVAFSKYENDDVMQSEAMDKLLRLAAALPDAFSYLKQQAGIIFRVDTQEEYITVCTHTLLKENKKDSKVSLRLVWNQSLSSDTQRKYA